ALNGTSDQSSVNETKPALFSATGNERFASDADTERFARMSARPAASGTQFDAAQRTFSSRDAIKSLQPPPFLGVTTAPAFD
ncbi:hypothetical protein, partial [Bradyrhizobium hipponense]|uniref:hypothetical protein n=1 Tax=Bradyrhizobium hipponense TaxID=2605638 RepID=UPI001AEDF39B